MLKAPKVNILAAVQTLRRIAEESEKFVLPEILNGDPDINPVTVALAKGVIDIAQSLPIDKIIVGTDTGRTARIISSFRPKQPIIALTGNETFKRQLNAVWGVIPTVMKVGDADRDKSIAEMIKKVVDDGLVNKDELILIVRGTTPASKNTNSLEVGLASEMMK